MEEKEGNGWVRGCSEGGMRYEDLDGWEMRTGRVEGFKGMVMEALWRN